MFGCLKKGYVKPTEVPSHESEGRSRKLGGLIGHSKADNGANSRAWSEPSDIKTEYKENTIVMKVSGLTTATRDDGRGRRGAAEELAEADCTEAISLHDNSYNNRAKGNEFWYLDGVIESKRFAQELSDAFNKKFPNKTSRGIKKASRGSRAYGVLDALRDNGIRKCCLAEWYFIDVESDYIDPREIGEFLKEFSNRP